MKKKRERSMEVGGDGVYIDLLIDPISRQQEWQDQATGNRDLGSSDEAGSESRVSAGWC